MDRYRTVTGRSRFHLDPIKGSRFVATVDRIRSEADATATIDAVRAEWPDARHHCWAWRLADGRARSSDAGEPGGSAGRPILAQIEGHGLHGVVVVVSRWFGGVKLGVGGLVRAYGGCAGKALDAAPPVDVVATTTLVVAHGWEDAAAIDALVAQEGLVQRDANWDDGVRRVLEVPSPERDRIVAQITDRTRGRARVEDGDDCAG